MSEFKTLTLIAVVVGVIVGLTAFFIFQVPQVYCAVLGLGAGLVFFFIILWSSYVFVFH